MNSRKLSVLINKPVKEVFWFALNPKNTPKWIDGIAEEKTNEWPVKRGSEYQNRGVAGNWNKYIVSEFEESKVFALKRQNGDYSVRYTFVPKSDRACLLGYHEWTETGKLDDTFSQEVLEKLKELVES